MRTRTNVCEMARNVSFLENFAKVINEPSQINEISRKNMSY